MPEPLSALDAMLAKVGKSKADFPRNSRMGKVLRSRGVSATSDLRRVLGLPRRRWAEDDGLRDLATSMTEWLARPPREECRRRCGHPKADPACQECVRASALCVCGGEGRMALRPVQAKALEDFHDFGGLLAPIRVGGGKTLISMLAPVVRAAVRPLLMVPAKLRLKTEAEFRMLRRHWLFHPRLELMTYEALSRDGGEKKLADLNPDQIGADEAHRAKSTNAGVTRKLRRWATEHPEVVWLIMSGTITTRSLRDYGHLSKWSLKGLSPLPEHANELADWADCLDTKVEENRRLQPGALLGLCDDAELAEVASDPAKALPCARRAFRRRLVETPGVVATEEQALGISLFIGHEVVDISADCASDFKRLRDDWETPDGHPFTEALDLWRHARALACGLFNRWDPAAPEEWLAARKEWAKFVREILASRRKGIDTEFQVAKACKSGDLDDSAYAPWAEIRDSFKPNSVPVWRHGKMLDFAKKWIMEGDGIVWTEHVAFGESLSELTGLPYFGEGGTDASGTMIEETRCGQVIASIASNSEGRNLQRWNRCLVVSPPPNGRFWEQMLGRCHREGQQADEVSYTIALACREQWSGLQQAFQDARYVEETTGQPQKLLYADKDLPTADVMANMRGPMWQ